MESKMLKALEEYIDVLEKNGKPLVEVVHDFIVEGKVGEKVIPLTIVLANLANLEYLIRGEK